MGGCVLLASSLVPTRPGWDNRGRAPGRQSREEEPTSDYTPGGEIHYGNPRAVTSNNIRALSAEKVRTLALCATAPYSPGLDVFGIEPKVNQEALHLMVSWALKSNNIRNLRSLKGLLGPGRAQAITADFLASGRTPSGEEIIHLCASRAAELDPKAHIPFVFMGVEDQTALTGPFTRELVDAPAWYGGAYSS